MIQADRSEIDGKKHDIDREINRLKKAIHTRKRKSREHRELSLRVVELRNSKTEIKNSICASKQLISHIEKAKDLIKFKIKELKWKTENLSSENPFHSTEYLEMQKEEIMT